MNTNRQVIGKWENIGWTSKIDDNSCDNLNRKSGEFNELYFLPEGESYWIFEGWTEDRLFIHYGGNEPILSYKYDLKDIDGRLYLFLRMDKKTEIFVKINSNIYSKETLGRHDNIDLPFVYDEKIIGKWNSVSFVNKMGDFNPLNIDIDLCLKLIEFFPDGKLIQLYMDEEWIDKWTKGKTINLHRCTVSNYVIKKINNI